MTLRDRLLWICGCISDDRYKAKDIKKIIEKQLYDLVIAERTRAKNIAKNMKIPYEKDLTENTKRAEFYQKHIKTAWIQCANKIAEQIENLDDLNEENQDASL